MADCNTAIDYAGLVNWVELVPIPTPQNFCNCFLFYQDLRNVLLGRTSYMVQYVAKTGTNSVVSEVCLNI